jgi:hypothetical protein
MLDKSEGKALMTKVVERFKCDVERNPQLIKRRLLSEQDITTKFVLPMLEALDWKKYEIGSEGPEVHEKAYREKSNVGKGLPDIILKSENGTIFVEVKRPGEIKKGIANLERYGDADLMVLTTFEDLRVYTRYGRQKPKLRFELDFRQYVTKFDRLWETLSNSRKGKSTRAALKATR